MNTNFHSVRSLAEKVELAIAQGRLNAGLNLIHDFVERIITEPLCTAQVFASRELDGLCIKIGRSNLHDAIESRFYEDVADVDANITVYIVSRLQSSGGHSRLVLDFIRAQPEKNHLILSTEISGSSDGDYILQCLSGIGNVQFKQAPRGDFRHRLLWLQSILLRHKPERVHLFNHHQDSVAIAALVPELDLDVSFYHHGDHHLCLGVYMSHVAHVDLHPMGYHHCRNELAIENCYLPLTFEDKGGTLAATCANVGGGLITATAARSNKIEIPYYLSYIDLIPHIIKATRGKHIHIGRLTPWALRRIRKGIRKEGLPKDCFLYIEWVPSVWRALQEHCVDAYIASFPYGAGLTLIEAMGASVPVIMHQHMYSRILSGLELAYPEAFHWSDPEDLLAHLEGLRAEQLVGEKQLSRAQYEKFHTPEVLVAYLQKSESSTLAPPPLAREFSPRHDEWAALIDSQLNISRLLYRLAYRTLRRLRRWMR
ncbi:hypothetical protein [Oryzisolibacter sp. LB2S]|uniref:hypothetical protein n=1 Tax=Alicycliphilus soli TaxID=3228789 RepID=UPI003459FDA1